MCARQRFAYEIIMHHEQREFLTLRIAPARLTVQEAAWFLGFSSNEMSVLMADGLLKPLGHAPRNGQKYFATAELEDLRRDSKWLAKASDAIVAYWRRRNKYGNVSKK